MTHDRIAGWFYYNRATLNQCKISVIASTTVLHSFSQTDFMKKGDQPNSHSYTITLLGKFSEHVYDATNVRYYYHQSDF